MAQVAYFTINFEAKNRLLVHFSGTVKDFNETFATELHICMRKNPLHSGDPFPVYCTLDSFTLPSPWPSAPTAWPPRTCRPRPALWSRRWAR
ncbi:hypothetical protein OV079_26130 [Nannocystis pusilla]|uniref:Uncharacterized protein n=1 Tax=Nannocystis pusilla TaxID=889268 RepID=A0A9X3F083_9BACT|nr:hypothetical protein [Nannocystis pusilla]MCY1008973.1 hypothetical protein [Nannocystis pusilla]